MLRELLYNQRYDVSETVEKQILSYFPKYHCMFDFLDKLPLSDICGFFIDQLIADKVWEKEDVN